MTASPTLPSLPDYLTESEFAELTRLKKQTLANWRCRRVGPKYLKLGSAVRYKRADVLAFLDGATVTPSAKGA